MARRMPSIPARGSDLGLPGSGLSGYRMPAEWEPHAATWLAWPHYEGDWPAKFEPIPWVYAEIIRHLAKHERVELIVNDAAAGSEPDACCNGRMHCHPIFAFITGVRTGPGCETRAASSRSNR